MGAQMLSSVPQQACHVIQHTQRREKLRGMLSLGPACRVRI